MFWNNWLDAQFISFSGHINTIDSIAESFNLNKKRNFEDYNPVKY